MSHDEQFYLHVGRICDMVKLETFVAQVLGSVQRPAVSRHFDA